MGSTTTSDELRTWEPMALRRVGDVSLVMTRKSGHKHDPGWSWRRGKRKYRHH
jgi:hypothetical protein